MPVEISDLTEIPLANISDDDWLIIEEVGLGLTYKITRGNLFKDVVRDAGDHNLGTSTIDDLTATVAEVGALTIGTSVQYPSNRIFTNAYVASAAVAPSDIAAGAGQTMTLTLTGAAVADTLMLSFRSLLPDGLVTQAWISAADTVSIRFHNTTGTLIAGASYTANAIAFKAS